MQLFLFLRIGAWAPKNEAEKAPNNPCSKKLSLPGLWLPSRVSSSLSTLPSGSLFIAVRDENARRGES